MITEEEKVWLQRHFEEKEIRVSLNLCSQEKAPGPYGYPMVFFQTFWALFKEDITNTIQFFSF